MTELEQFMRLFQGRTDAYGTGKGQWIKKRPRDYVYSNHLQGLGPGLGIAPLLDDGTVWFAAVDLDEPNFEAAKEIQSFLSFGGAAWIERSRSGNAHVWVFFAEPIEAWIPRGIMREATAAVGKPAVEIFPKQDRLLEGMVGNYINLPYHGTDRPMLWVGGEYKLGEWLRLAPEELCDVPMWHKRADWLSIVPPEQRERGTSFGEAKELHRCAEHIIANRDANPVAEGHRNVVFFNLCKMMTNYEGFSHDDAWYSLCLVCEASEAAGYPPVDKKELERILRNAERGGFTSTGCDDPLMAPYVDPNCPIAKGLQMRLGV